MENFDKVIKENKRTNETNKNTYGTLMKIVKYNRCDDIIVEFQDEYKYKSKSTYDKFLKGSIKNPYDKEVYGIGYIGVGKYKTRINNKQTRKYKIWKGILQRCYDPYFINKHLSYKDCFVCNEWHNFQNFAQWYDENIYNCDNERIHLDKDISYKGNKIYSPETCIFVPQRINGLFIKRDIDRGVYPIGVCLNKRDDKLYARCNIIDKNGKSKFKFLDSFSLNKPFQAFTCYKNFKENYIKQVADEYKDLIPIELYNAMYEWEVEIND
jgi:hypothetical protein